MKVIYTVIVAILIIVVITFSLENTAPVKLHYLGYEFFMGPIPAYMLLFIAFLAGVIFTGFMGIVERFRLTRTINRLNKTIRDLRREMKTNEISSDVGSGVRTSPPPREEIL